MITNKLFIGVLVLAALTLLVFFEQRQQRPDDAHIRANSIAITATTSAFEDPYFHLEIPYAHISGAIPRSPKVVWMPKVQGGHFYITARNLGKEVFILPEKKEIKKIRLSASEAKKTHPCLIISSDSGEKEILFSGEWSESCKETPSPNPPPAATNRPQDRIQ